ncbi:MAG: type II secretion system protein [Fidelibacterota bacterium]
MKQRIQEQGFTLIELIMVIVIMGILAAVVVPKFFNLEDRTHAKVQESVIGNIKAGLMLYSVNNMADNGKKEYPDHASSTVLSDVLDEIPEGWSYNSGATTGSFEYSGRGATDLRFYTYTRGGTANARTYTIGAEQDTQTDPAN